MANLNGNENGDSSAHDADSVFAEFADAVNKGDTEAAEEATLKVWEHIASAQDDEPSPWLQAMETAHQCEATFDWPGALTAYDRAAQVTEDQPMLQYQAYHTLSGFHKLFDQDSQALEAARLSTQSARREGMPLLISLALQTEARLRLQSKEYAIAWDLIIEAFEFIGDGPMDDLQRVYALLLRADYYIENERLDEAQGDLTSAWSVLEPWASMFYAAGWQGCFAHWWGTTGRLRSQSGDKAGAVDAWRQAVWHRRIIAQLPQLEGPYKHNSLAHTLRNLGRALQDISDPQAAESFKESQSIRQAIGLPLLEV